MKNYRCVFIYTGGNTSIEVTAGGTEHAIEVAADATNASDYDRAEVWEGDHLLLAKTTPRPWDFLNDSAPSSEAEAGTAQPRAQLSATHPRRASSPPGAGVKGVGASLTGLRQKASRKG